MSREEHSAPIYKWRILSDFRSTMSCLPKRHQLPPCARFYTVDGPICSQKINSKKVCRVFVLRCQSASYPIGLVSSRRVHLSHTICIQSYEHAYIHTFLHPYSLTFIHTLILSRIHTFMHTPHIHNINSYMIWLVTQSLGRPHPSVSLLCHVSSG